MKDYCLVFTRFVCVSFSLAHVSVVSEMFLLSSKNKISWRIRQTLGKNCRAYSQNVKTKNYKIHPKQQHIMMCVYDYIRLLDKKLLLHLNKTNLKKQSQKIDVFNQNIFPQPPWQIVIFIPKELKGE